MRLHCGECGETARSVRVLRGRECGPHRCLLLPWLGRCLAPLWPHGLEAATISRDAAPASGPQLASYSWRPAHLRPGENTSGHLRPGGTGGLTELLSPRPGGRLGYLCSITHPHPTSSSTQLFITLYIKKKCKTEMWRRVRKNLSIFF